MGGIMKGMRSVEGDGEEYISVRRKTKCTSEIRLI
jgi:hypothetical protein